MIPQRTSYAVHTPLQSNRKSTNNEEALNESFYSVCEITPTDKSKTATSPTKLLTKYNRSMNAQSKQNATLTSRRRTSVDTGSVGTARTGTFGTARTDRLATNNKSTTQAKRTSLTGMTSNGTDQSRLVKQNSLVHPAKTHRASCAGINHTSQIGEEERQRILRKPSFEQPLRQDNSTKLSRARLSQVGNKPATAPQPSQSDLSPRKGLEQHSVRRTSVTTDANVRARQGRLSTPATADPVESTKEVRSPRRRQPSASKRTSSATRNPTNGKFFGSPNCATTEICRQAEQIRGLQAENKRLKQKIETLLKANKELQEEKFQNINFSGSPLVDPRVLIESEASRRSTQGLTGENWKLNTSSTICSPMCKSNEKKEAVEFSESPLLVFKPNASITSNSLKEQTSLSDLQIRDSPEWAVEPITQDTPQAPVVKEAAPSSPVKETAESPSSYQPAVPESESPRTQE